jgi:cytochrome P450
VLAVGVVGFRRRATQWLRRRYGTAATIRIPVVGDAVVISDPALVKQLFMTSTDVIGYNEPNLGIVQRTRPVIDGTARRVIGESLSLGEWEIPHGYHVLVSILAVHEDDAVFPNAAAFDPDRFVGTPPDTYSWIPFGGGTRRCVGSAFATMEMDVVVRTLLRHYELAPSHRRDERWHSRGIAFAPAKGGLAVVRPRSQAAGQGEGREVRRDDVRRTVQHVA